MDNLEEIKIKIGAIGTLEKKLASYSHRIKEAEENADKLLDKYEKQKLDVQRIQKESLYFYLLKLFGRYEGKLKKEEREEIEAKLRFDRAAAELEELRKGKAEIAAKLTELRGLAYQYQTELDRRRAAAMRLEGENGERYRQLENEINFLAAQLIEIDQALTAALRSKQSAQIVLDALRKAEGWAIYDTFESGGLILHMAKYSHIDNAESSFNRLISQLKSLQTELHDIKDFELPDFYNISPAERAFDYWFDNFIIDIFVCNKIRDNIAHIRDLIYFIVDLENRLNERRAQLSGRLNSNRHLQEELLIRMD